MESKVGSGVTFEGFSKVGDKGYGEFQWEFRVKRGFGWKDVIVHLAEDSFSAENWEDAWNALMLCVQGCCDDGRYPAKYCKECFRRYWIKTHGVDASKWHHSIRHLAPESLAAPSC